LLEPLRKRQPGEPRYYTNLSLWHGTSSDNYWSIMEKGLIPGFTKPAGQEWLGEYHGRGIYAIKSPPFDPPLHLIEGDCTIMFGFLIPKIPAEYITLDEEEGASPEEIPRILSREYCSVVVGAIIKPELFKAIYIQGDNYSEECNRLAQKIYEHAQEEGLIAFLVD